MLNSQHGISFNVLVDNTYKLSIFVERKSFLISEAFAYNSGMIEIKSLNFSYPNGKGIFDINFDVRKGQVVGFLGPNGAGKTTTIRCILGFMQGASGSVAIDGMHSFNDASSIAHKVGYIAGEPAFPDGMTGREYLDFMMGMRVETNPTAFKKEQLKNKVEELIQYFELDPTHKIKRMSKGMKQKTAIIGAVMHDPAIYILDEPTSGLDPLMQAKFIDFMQKEKASGKTILISSHMFEEIERTADRVLIIKDGRIVKEDNVKNLKSAQRKVFVVRGKSIATKEIALPEGFDKNIVSEEEVHFQVPQDQVDKFIKAIAKHNIDDIEQRIVTLEEIFMGFYAKEQKEGA